MNLKELVFSLFGGYEKAVDSYKDEEGRGILERFNRICAEEFDTYFQPAIDGMLDNLLVPDLAYVKFVPYLEDLLGSPPVLKNTVAFRRKILKNIIQLYKIKGTNTAYKILFGMLGFTTVTIVETYPSSSLDSDFTMDDPGRRWDGGCQPCSNFTIDLAGDVTINPGLVDGIYNIIDFNKPINARLKGITFDGGTLVKKIISVEVNELGDLVYDNEYDPDLILSLSKDGDLLVDGPEKDHYSLDANGDLIYTI